MFGLIALGWVDWIDAGRVEDGTHNATGDLKCLRLMNMLSPRIKMSMTPQTKVLEERTWGNYRSPYVPYRPDKSIWWKIVNFEK